MREMTFNKSITNFSNKIEPIFREETLKILDLLTIELFKLSKSNINDYQPRNIKNHVSYILSTLKSIKQKGFISN
jgi:hypothetical protein